MNDYNKLSNMILNTKISSLKGHTNCICLKCSKCEEDMIRVGALIFCFECVKMFKTTDPVREERELYLKWVNKDKESRM